MALSAPRPLNDRDDPPAHFPLYQEGGEDHDKYFRDHFRMLVAHGLALLHRELHPEAARQLAFGGTTRQIAPPRNKACAMKIMRVTASPNYPLAQRTPAACAALI